VTVLHQGRVLARGTPAGIAADPAVLDVYLGGVPLDREATP
jgi:ABC-type branched-subunit amino acid transport system ATPase component